MKVRVGILVPVSSQEPEWILLKSLESISKLRGDFSKQVIYVIDLSDQDTRPELVSRYGFKPISRNHNRGRRAGALNLGLEALREFNPDYIAILDVDSRPDPNFLDVSISKLESDPQLGLIGGERYITNPRDGLIPRILEAEYWALADILRVLNRLDGFKHLNGAIGVMRAELGFMGFDETKICEDIDFVNRIYLRGYIVKSTRWTRIGEQAPRNLSDLISQRIRWCSGALESLGYFTQFLRAKIPLRRKLSWLGTMICPFMLGLLSPTVLAYAPKLWKLSSGSRDFLIKLAGLFFQCWLIQICSWIALFKKLLRRRVCWRIPQRSAI